MKTKLFYAFLSLACVSGLSLSADEQEETAVMSEQQEASAANEQEETQIHLSAAEVQEIFNNPDRSYVYLGKEVSVIPQVIAEISKLEENKESLVCSLADHMEKGFVIGNYEAVVLALEQAEVVLTDNADKLEENMVKAFSESLAEIIYHVKANTLTLTAEMLSFLKDAVAEAQEATEEVVPAEEVAAQD